MPIAAFRRLRDRRRRDETAARLYRCLVESVRRPEFFQDLAVPDTLEGRYDLLVVHAHQLLRRLARCGASTGDEGKVLAQAVFDLMFADMDQNLREMGIADLGIGKRIRKLAEAFYGRVGAYDEALATGEPALARALARNLYQTASPSDDQLRAMARFVLSVEAALASTPDTALLAGDITFPDVLA